MYTCDTWTYRLPTETRPRVSFALLGFRCLLGVSEQDRVSTQAFRGAPLFSVGRAGWRLHCLLRRAGRRAGRRLLWRPRRISPIVSSAPLAEKTKTGCRSGPLYFENES